MKQDVLASLQKIYFPYKTLWQLWVKNSLVDLCPAELFMLEATVEKLRSDKHRALVRGYQITLELTTSKLIESVPHFNKWAAQKLLERVLDIGMAYPDNGDVFLTTPIPDLNIDRTLRAYLMRSGCDTAGEIVHVLFDNDAVRNSTLMKPYKETLCALISSGSVQPVNKGGVKE